MKTKSQTKQSGLGSRSAIASSESSTAEAQHTPAQAEKKDRRLPIDGEARKQNRTLPTPKVLKLLQASLPDVYGLAEVVGKWIWVHFTETPAAEIRQQLAPRHQLTSERLLG